MEKDHGDNEEWGRRGAGDGEDSIARELSFGFGRERGRDEPQWTGEVGSIS